ncbi:AsmA family protein [Carboxylicivirga marina]|uniref:DUF748 domain-containing protein n=1 Tax=Carboxylicivirga marina TaxID=2800988 RepID=A0ABS1HJ07_9BACT|nr:DUF748 domain-containing protein [Carboxylicivirga marina]MBK3517595.1 DUF748 domain-containing protein [Carboxylicivirga marina]
MKHVKKRHYVLITLALIIFLVLFFLSSIIKNYVNKNSKELIGRKVELADLSFNYFRVSLSATNLMVYETNETDTFAGIRELTVNFDPTKLIKNEYSFSSILIDSSFINIINDEDGFNFNDLIPESDSLEVEENNEESDTPFRFSIHDIKIQHGHASFDDKTVDTQFRLVDISLDLPKIAWDSESSSVGINFEFGKQGNVSIQADVDQIRNEYDIDFKLNQLEFGNITNYAKTMIDIGGIKGYLNADLNFKGSLVRTNEINISGQTSIENFSLWDTADKEVVNLEKLSVGLTSIDLANENYQLSHIAINKPTITAELYKDMSNIERLLLPVTEVDSTIQAAPIQAEADTSDHLFYSIDHLSVSEGEIIFADHTLYRPFQYDIKEINVNIDNINPQNESVPVNFSMNMNDQGTMDGTSAINMINPAIFEMEAHVKRLRLMSFSPYTEYHIARPITQGDITYDLSINMTPTHMANNNDIVIKELEIGSKTQHEPQVKAPVKLGLYLMKDPKDVITIHMPVEGNPSNPNFSVRKLVWKAFSNRLVKVAASPFNALGNLVSTRPEELENIPMPYAQDSLLADQKQVLDKIAQITEKKPQLIFSFEQQTDPDEEKASMAIKAAKKRMLAEKMPLNTEQDISNFNTALAQLEDNDAAFLAYISKNISNADTMELTQSCIQLIGEDELDDEFQKLLLNRNAFLRYYLIEEKGVDSTSIEVNTADLRNLPEELRSCNYKVEVSVK